MRARGRAGREGSRRLFGAAASVAGDRWRRMPQRLVAALLALAATARVPLQPDLSVVPTRHPLDFRPVLKNRKAVAYIIAYGGHCWELFAFRAWLPTFLLFAWHRFSSASAGLQLSRWSMLIIAHYQFGLVEEVI